MDTLTHIEEQRLSFIVLAVRKLSLLSLILLYIIVAVDLLFIQHVPT